MLTFDELWEQLTTQDESCQIEVKRGSDVGKPCWNSISAFSNEPGLGGGYLILGIKDPKNTHSGKYEIEGVKDPDKIQQDLANQCKESFNNLMYRVTNKVDTLTASQHLRRLRDAGLLEQQGKGRAIYYILNPNLDSNTDKTETLSGQLDNPNLDSRTTATETLSGQLDNPNLDSNTKEAQQLTLELFTPIKTESLEKRLTKIRKRNDPEEIKTLILELCQEKAHSSSELENVLKRKRKYLLDDYLKPLIAEGLLEYTKPEKPNNPHQTYRTTQNTEDQV